MSPLTAALLEAHRRRLSSPLPAPPWGSGAANIAAGLAERLEGAGYDCARLQTASRAEIEAAVVALYSPFRGVPRGRVEWALAVGELLRSGWTPPAGPPDWLTLLSLEGGTRLLRTAIREGITPETLPGWTSTAILALPGVGRRQVLGLRDAAAAHGIAWGHDLGGEIPPVVPRTEAPAPALSSPTWRDALHLAGGDPLVRRARSAGIDSPEALARLSSGDVARLGGWGRVRLQQLRRAALSVGLDWAPDLERRPGQPSLSGEGESPRVSVALPAALAAQVEARAGAAGEPVSAWIRRAVEAALAAGGAP